MTITLSEVEKNRNPDVFKWSKGFDRYFNAADYIFNFSSFLRAQAAQAHTVSVQGPWPPKNDEKLKISSAALK